MKSVITQGATVAKAIEEALKKADMPKEFFVKLLEDAQAGFLGFGSKKAKIALFFKEEIVGQKHQESMFERGSYENLFNNPNMKKQIELQLKELGLEIKPIESPKPTPTISQNRPERSETKRFESVALNVAPKRTAPISQEPAAPTKMHTRPLPNRSERLPQRPIQPRIDLDEQRPLPSIDGSFFEDDAQEQTQSDEMRRKRRPRFYRPRSRAQVDGQRDSSVAPSNNKPNSDGSNF